MPRVCCCCFSTASVACARQPSMAVVGSTETGCRKMPHGRGRVQAAGRSLGAVTVRDGLCSGSELVSLSVAHVHLQCMQSAAPEGKGRAPENSVDN